MVNTPEGEFGKCRIKDCENQAEANITFAEDGFVQADLELCSGCADYQFSRIEAEVEW